MSLRARAILLGAGLFGLGGLAGGLTVRIVDLRSAKQLLTAPAAERRATVVRFVLEHRLELDDAQRRQLDDALAAQAPLLEEQERAVAPHRTALRDDLLERSRAFLDDEQQRRLEQMIAEANARDARR